MSSTHDSTRCVELGDIGKRRHVYYVDEERRARAVSCCGISSVSVDEARELIRAGEPVTKGALGERVG